jgi:glutamate-1-semialdehyde 2,1-aminomutase
MTEREIELAEILTARIPSAERIRFANSGSEAVMMALRIARGFTGRSLIVKFEGAYHGTYDDVQWSVGPSPKLFGDARRPTPVPDTAGLPGGDGRVLVLPYGDAGVLEDAMAAHGDDVACIIVEPMCNRIGLVVPPPEFFQAARRLCDAHGAVLIFDEVIAFRLGYHGAQGVVGVTPDMTTLGKVIGGGFPVGGVAGRADILAVSDPGAKNRVAHAGTFNANPVTAAAGAATMTALDPQAFERINAMGAEVRRRLTEIVAGLPITITGAGSLFKINATAVPVTDYRSAVTVDAAWEKLVSQLLLIDGFMLTPTLHGCVSTVTERTHVERFLDAFAAIVRS